MEKLRTMQPALRSVQSRLSSPREGAGREAARKAMAPWRKWYSTARWRKLRKQILARDSYVCQQTGVLLIGKHPAPNSPAVDHIRKHRGDPNLFWDPDNLQAVSKEWHDREKQSQERRADR